MLRRSDIYTIFTCVRPNPPNVALQSLSSINFFSLVLLSTVEIRSLSNDENGKKHKSIHLFATCTRMAVAFAIIVLSKQLKKFLRVNATALSFCCK